MADAERLITPGTRLVVVNSPHNPSGAHFSQQEWRRLGELCQAAGAHLFRCVVYVRGLVVLLLLLLAGLLPADFCMAYHLRLSILANSTACTDPAWPAVMRCTAPWSLTQQTSCQQPPTCCSPAASPSAA
jgi:hypothetical protein